MKAATVMREIPKLNARDRHLLERVERASMPFTEGHFRPSERGRLEAFTAHGLVTREVKKIEGCPWPVGVYAITDAGRAAARYPFKPTRPTHWLRQPKGPGEAWHMFTDAHGERVELLAFAAGLKTRPYKMIGFEIYARDYKGEYAHHVGSGEAASLSLAMRAALAMVARPRLDWKQLPVSWGTP